MLDADTRRGRREVNMSEFRPTYPPEYETDGYDDAMLHIADLQATILELIRLGNIMEGFIPSYGLQLDAKANWQQATIRAITIINQKNGGAK